jgi:hypothetical protein
MILLRDDGHHEPDKTLNLAPPAASSAEFLFDTNERLKKCDIAVTHSKQTTATFSIRYKWKLLGAPHRHEKISIYLNSAVRTPRA